MLDEFRRYCALQRGQVPLATLLIYLKRKGGWTQLNQIWKELGPSGGGPFWNQTTLINKLNKLEKLGIILVDRRVLPSNRVASKRKTNTFCRLNSGSLIAPHIFSMLKVKKKGDSERFTSELVEKPLDGLISEVSAVTELDPMVEKERQIAFELIGEVFDISQEDVEGMIRERLASRGLISSDGSGGGRGRPRTSKRPGKPKRQPAKKSRKTAAETAGDGEG